MAGVSKDPGEKDEVMRQFDWKPIYTGKKIAPSAVSKITKKFKLSRIGSEVLLRRGLKDPSVIKKYLYGSYKDMYDPYLFKDMLRAVHRVVLARNHKEKIFIHGDYDCDGITGTAILKMALDEIGAVSEPYVPHRSLGYGLSKDAVDHAIHSGVGLIITCDCGSNETGPLALARRNKIDVIVMDHHSYQKRPKVFAFLNPEEPEYPFKDLCGAGVALKFIQALDRVEKTHPEAFLDLVAVATVADAVPLLDENRIIVKEGLKRLSSTNHTGMRNLLKVCSLYKRKISTEMVGFIIAPKINAPGRIDHPNKSLELLLTIDEKKADELAHELARINKQRMGINTQIRDQAIAMIEEKYKNDCFIVLSDDSWNKGVVGIVASTIVELYHKPTAIISNGYGSVRTVPEFPLLGPLEECSDLFQKWGGHPMAAGLKVRKKNIDAFRKRINKVAGRTLSPNPSPYMNYDAKLKLGNVNMSLVEEMEKLEPFGNNNPLPQFVVEDVNIARNRVTKDGQHIQLSVRKDNSLSSAVGFWMSGHKDLFVDPAQKFDMLFLVERNRGNYEQIIIKDIKEVELNW